jgi:hypothetical protein
MPHGSLHLPKSPPRSGVVVSVTCVPAGTVAEQLSPPRPQTIPPESLVTVPGPLTESERVAVFRTKVALTALAAYRETKHLGAVPTQPPLQWSKTEKLSGVAPSETTAPRR